MSSQSNKAKNNYISRFFKRLGSNGESKIAIAIICAITIAYTLLFPPTVFYIDINRERTRVKNRIEATKTLTQVIEKASGLDGKLQQEEFIQLARDMGYQGKIPPYPVGFMIDEDGTEVYMLFQHGLIFTEEEMKFPDKYSDKYKDRGEIHSNWLLYKIPEKNILEYLDDK